MRDIDRSIEIGFHNESKERRAKHRATSPQILQTMGIEFESKNNGTHLVITLPDRCIDFWPGTGLFTDRKTKKNGRGVHKLAQKIGALTGKGAVSEQDKSHTMADCKKRFEGSESPPFGGFPAAPKAD